MLRRSRLGLVFGVFVLSLMMPVILWAQQESESAPESMEPDETAPEEEQSLEVDESSELAVEEEQAAAVEEGAIGPGGRELRTDYPGTEESLQPRMDTGRVEGQEGEGLENSEEVFDLRVRELETQIDDLKERVFRSKSRIILLKETVLAENLAGSRAVITFENDLGAGYEVYRGVFSVDGSRVHSSVDIEELKARDGIAIYDAPMTPGTHTISVSLGLRSSGYGLFSYARGYEFGLRFSCQFTAEEGRTTLMTVRTFKGGNVFTAHEDRPAGVCRVSMVELNIDDVPDAELPTE